MIGSIDFGGGQTVELTPTAAIVIVRQLLAALEPSVAAQLAREVLDAPATLDQRVDEAQRELLATTSTPDSREPSAVARMLDRREANVPPVDGAVGDEP